MLYGENIVSNHTRCIISHSFFFDILEIDSIPPHHRHIYDNVSDLTRTHCKSTTLTTKQILDFWQNLIRWQYKEFRSILFSAFHLPIEDLAPLSTALATFSSPTISSKPGRCSSDRFDLSWERRNNDKKMRQKNLKSMKLKKILL